MVQEVFFKFNRTKRNVLSKILIVGMIFGFSAIPHSSQASELRVTVSWEMKITITFKYTFKKPSGLPQPLTPEGVEVFPGKTGSSAMVAKWRPSRWGKPKDGYTIIIRTLVNQVRPSTSLQSSYSYFNVGRDVTELEITDLPPSTFAEVVVEAKDGGENYPTNENSFCTPKFYETDAGCIFN